MSIRVFTRARLLFLGTAGLLLLLHILGALGSFEGLIARILRPIQRPLAQSMPWSNKHPVSAISSENVLALEDHVARLSIENALLRDVLAKRTAIKDEQEFLEQHKLHGVDAAIIGQTTEGDEPIVIIDAGTEHGIREGQAVIFNDGILVGTVEKAESRRSTVLLITSTRIRVGAEVENTTRSQGIVSGEHGLTFLMKYIPQGEIIEKGQTVITSAVDEKIPANLLIGNVSEVRFHPGDLFQEAAVRPLIDIKRVRFVTIIAKG